MSNYNIKDAFKALEILNESMFDVDDNSIKNLETFLDGDAIDDSINVIDTEAETQNDIKVSYIGQVILRCPVCTSLIYKKPEEIVLDEGSTYVNISEECPICNEVQGFEIVGQVSEYCADCEEKADNEEVEDKEIEDTEDKLEESLNEGLSDNDRVRKALGLPLRSEDKLEEDFKNVSITTDDSHMEMESNENGKVTVTTEPIYHDIEGIEEPEEKEEEVISPLTAETEEKIEQTNDEDYEEEDIEFDDFDEETFDDLEERYLKEIYDNVKSYKTTQGSIKDNSLMLEGVIEFNSGKKVKTTSIFESAYKLKNGKLKFHGLNEQFAKSNKAFILTGKKEGKKLMVESLTYNYNAKDNITGKSKRIYGKVSK